jgi:5-methylcytosine-specific restriction endonuclease McrA
MLEDYFLRKVPEWIGKTDDTQIPPRVRLRIFDRCGGICHQSGRKIQVGEHWQLDHVVALANGGGHCESNLVPVLIEPHKEKTVQDIKEKALVAKKRKSFLGIRAKKKRMGYRKFNGEVVKPRFD